MTHPLWTGEEIAAATGARPVGAAGPVSGASIDTRTLRPGDLFFAIQGEARDGHDFVRAAFERGAAAAVVADSRADEFAGAGALFAVPDVLAAMVSLGVASRARMRGGVVAVTGSVGKTGTKEAMRLVLERQGATHASVASYNNHWGVPLTLVRMPRDARFGVFEIGMNHAAEIAPLTRMVRPHVAVITTVEPVHVEHFRSVQGIADAKGEIFAGIEPGGVAVINRDNPHFERLRSHALASPAGSVLTFGEHEAADIRAERIALHPDATLVDARVLGRAITYRLGAPGRHVAMNSLSILAAAHALGLDVAEVAGGLADLEAPVGRGQRTVLHLPGGSATLIDESYNANPASMRAALATLAAAETGPGGRRIAVMGDMLELGPEAASLHAGLAEPVAASGVDLVFAAGSLMRNLAEALPPGRLGGYAGSAAELKGAVLAAIRPGDVVMIKGSNSTRMSQIVQALKDMPDAGASARSSRG